MPAPLSRRCACHLVIHSNCRQTPRRKGAGKFLLDRTLRLVVPCIFYSFLAPPFILFWNEMAKNPAADPAATLAAQFRLWLQPGWPSKYNLATGPVSFVINL